MNTNGYCSPPNDMDFGGMFDQYVHKGSENFDLSLTVPESSAHQPPYMGDQQPNHYGAYESGVVRPSTADSGYQEMNPMTSPSLGGHDPPPQTAPMPIPQQQQHPHQQQAMYQMAQMPGLHHAGPHHNPQFPPQSMYIPPISQHGNIMANQTSGYMGQNMGHANPVYTNATLGMHPVHHHAPHPMMGTAGGMMPANYYHRPHMGGKSSSSPTSGGSPSPGSEDSDDSSNLNKINRVTCKRPSPETLTEPIVPIKGKKARVSKRSKKKKDPNEPQKPVSAYALFFRDTQAAIKGQNPNASFGEVSKIVASMWDSLDAENKGVYKKKTESAKKDYLKALAAYRASFVSKGGEGDPMYGGGGQPYGGAFGSNPPTYGYANTKTVAAHPPPPQQLTPLAKKSPLLSSLMTTSEAGGQQQQQTLMSPPMSQPMPPSAPTMMGGHMPPMNAPQVVPNPHPPPHQQPCPPTTQGHILHNMTTVPPTSPYLTQSNTSLGSPVSSSDVDSPGVIQSSQPQSQQPHQHQPPHTTPQISPQHPQSMHPDQQQQQVSQNTAAPHNGNRCNNGRSCIRFGCNNQAVHNAEWENEYCSNECVVSHCKDVFHTWVEGNQSNAPTYPASVK